MFESQLARRYCQTFSTGFSSGERDGKKISVMFFRDAQAWGYVPAGAVEQHDSMGAARHLGGDFVQMRLHRLGVGVGQRQSRADGTRRADGAKQIGVLITLVGGLARSRSALGPLANLAVLLPNPGFILEPDFQGLARRNLGEMGFQRRGEVFLNAAIVSAF